jgi:acyl-CoA reductase-like NAD-dependent aldehyde dehydrogenase
MVAKVSFTGSPATGAAVLKSAAGNLTPSLMELGGKNPLVVFEDADLDQALLAAIDGGFFNQGEACTASSRLLVADSVYDEFTARLAAAVDKLVVGDGAVSTTEVGPMVTRAHQQRVLEYLRIGQSEGAKIVAQASLPTDSELADGFFVAPTLFTDVTEDMRVAQEEIFGPVVTVLRFQNEEEAIRIANGTQFGLVAGVYTWDSERAVRVSKRIRAGVVTVNNYVRAAIGSPFGGIGASGFGREHAPETLAEYGYSKTVRLASHPTEIPSWSAAVRTAAGASPSAQ